MRIGLVAVYPFRPHAEHLAYINHVLVSAGHQTFALSCDGAVPSCYPLLLRGRSPLKECTACTIGGVRSYNVDSVTSLRKKWRKPLPDEVKYELTCSASATLHRTETEADLELPEVVATRKSLGVSVEIMYGNALRWIEQKALEGVIVFNGRVDLTAAIAMAARDSGIPYLTYERTWFGHGLQFVPNANCLSLHDSDMMVEAYKDSPLTEEQARIAAKQIALRFQRQNDLEWRVYNRDATETTWPGTGTGPKTLIIPSSKNEFQGHPEWRDGWGDNTKALDELIEYLDLEPSNCVVRCHPNWSERIGRVSGQRSEEHYRTWAKSRGVHVIDSQSKADTYDLLEAADLAVLNGGSTAFEAAVLGKPVICLGPSKYRKAGFSYHVNGPDEWGNLSINILNANDHGALVRQALRFLYVQQRRFPQYVDFVRARSTTSFDYFAGADASRIIDMLTAGAVRPDDDVVADDGVREGVVIDQVLSRDWRTLSAFEEPWPVLPPLSIERRIGLRWLDSVRDRLPRGDRG